MDQNFDDTIEESDRGLDFSRPTKRRTQQSPTTPPKVSSSIGVGTKCFSTHDCRSSRGRRNTAAAMPPCCRGWWRGGVLPRRRADGQGQRHVDAGADTVRARHRRAAGSHPAQDGQRRGDLGAGLVRAGSGSDLAFLPRSTATKTDGGWLLNGHKIWSPRAPSASGHSAVPLRHGGRTPPRVDLLHVQPEGRRHHRAAHRAAQRRHRLRRDLPRRRVRARQRCHRRRARRLASRDEHVKQ